MKTSYHHRAYNLTIETPFPIRELIAIEPQKTDIVIREGSAADTLPLVTKQDSYFNGNMTVQVNDNDILITIKGIAKYHIQGNQTILIEREKDISDDDVILYLLGTCLTCLNMRKGFFALHGSTIHTDKGSIVFIGNSGVGKSTTAAKMIAKGYKLQADDVSFITFDAHNQPWVHPAYPQLKLWDKSVEKLGLEKEGLEFVSPLWQKFRVTAHEDFETKPTRLSAIYELAPTEQNTIEIVTLMKFNKIKVLIENTYRNYLIPVLGLEKAQFEFCAKLATSTPVKRLKRPHSLFLINELIEIIESDFLQHSF